jgi:hypothetical protein
MAVARHRLSLLLFTLAPLLGGALPAEARWNLPQRAQVVPLRKGTEVVARAFFARRVPPEHGLPREIEQLLLDSLPRDFRDACRKVVENWGAVALGSAEWRIRLLQQQSERVWLAFRCGSRWPDYRLYYDERLARLELASATLHFLPHGPDRGNSPELYHVDFEQRLPLVSASALVFRVVESTDNPCCDGPRAWRQERLLVYLDDARSTGELVAVVLHREEFSHDEQGGDTERVYRAHVLFQETPDGTFSSILVGFREDVNGKRERSGSFVLHWNPATSRFEESQ